MNIRTLALAALLLGGCGGEAGNEAEQAQGNAAAAPAAAADGNEAAAPGGTADRVLKSETVEAVFDQWEMGDYLWAHLNVEGREQEGAFVGPTPIEHFLEAHRGQPITVRIDTVMMDIPEAGGAEEVQKIAAASAGGVSAAQWWAGLSAEERAAAERRMEELLSGGSGLETDPHG